MLRKKSYLRIILNFSMVLPLCVYTHGANPSNSLQTNLSAEVSGYFLHLPLCLPEQTLRLTYTDSLSDISGYFRSTEYPEFRPDIGTGLRFSHSITRRIQACLIWEYANQNHWIAWSSTCKIDKFQTLGFSWGTLSGDRSGFLAGFQELAGLRALIQYPQKRIKLRYCFMPGKSTCLEFQLLRETRHTDLLGGLSFPYRIGNKHFLAGVGWQDSGKKLYLGTQAWGKKWKIAFQCVHTELLGWSGGLSYTHYLIPVH